MKRLSVVFVIVGLCSLLLVPVVSAAPSHASHRSIPQSCTWTLEATAGPFFFSGTGYVNVKEYSSMYADLCTGTGWNGDLKAISTGYTGASSECNYAFSARLEENNGGTHLNPAGQGSTVGCYDGNGDADDVVTVTSPISTGLTTAHCYYDASVYVSAFFNQTYANSGGNCP